MYFSKKTVLALTPFLLATPAVAAPHQNLQEKAVQERVIPAIIEGFGLATTVIDSVMTLIEGSGDSSEEESAPRSLGQIQGHGAQAVCISGEKPANPVWFRTQMRNACKKVAEVEDGPTTGKYENMISTIWKATADWGQELEFDLAWTYKPNVPNPDGGNTKFTVELCEDLVNAVGDQCTPSEYDGEPQTQGARPVNWNDEILVIMDVTEV